ncbi:MAG: DUF1573 domain-containing protein [Chlamydiae bacterium]|nr:DUF1573 domain-containing protein [Chlamydiota bacterium]MBI3276613.1 DUF1573 domain-containing protein [Chlamydiota bacterium]
MKCELSRPLFFDILTGMKPIKVVSTLIILFFIQSLSAFSEEVNPSSQMLQPHITFTEREHNFGDMIQGDKVSYDFSFKNEGNAPLKMGKIETSCGCTGAVAGKNELAPQESSVLHVTFNSTGRQGVFNKGIKVNSNDPSSPSVELTIHGTIRTPFQIEPQVINFGLMKLGESGEKELKIKADAYPKPLKITSIDKSSHVNVILQTDTLTREVWASVLVRFKAQMVGSSNETLVIHFEDPSMSPVTIPVIAHAQGPIRVIPPRINFISPGNSGNKAPQLPIQRIRLTATGSSSFEIVKMELDPQYFDLETETAEKGKSYEIVIHLKNDVKEKMLTRTLKIYTTDEAMNVIEIPVQVWVPTIRKS